MSPRILVAVACALVALAVAADHAAAHGLAGRRFFPSTLATEDPFVADELSFPSFTLLKRRGSADEPDTNEASISGEWSKRVTRDLGISLGGGLLHIDPQGGPTQTGFENLEVTLKYQFLRNAEHEAVAAIAVGWEVGGTGRKAVGSESFDVVDPSVLFGKGFGDLPSAVSALRPLALTGLAGVRIPTRGSTRTVRVDGDEVEEEIERHPNVFHWGLALQYSLPYLQSFVKDVGLPAPFDRMIPLVEVEFSHPLDRGRSGQYTGTVNPGVIWAGTYFQIGVEAILPVNERTGKNVGVRALLHFFLDDIFPTSLGRPLFGGR